MSCWVWCVVGEPGQLKMTNIKCHFVFIYQMVGDISVHDQSVGLSGMNNKEDLEMTLQESRW